MSKETMPAAEAQSYELAFHVLPTVAEGEVAEVFQTLKDLITKAGGELGVEEAPARFELAYEIVKHLEGRNRKFSSAYFGWVRFTVDPAKVEHLDEEIGGNKSILRHLIIKLTKVEEENPYFFHQAMAEQGKSETIDLDEEEAEATTATDEDASESETDSEVTEDKE
ncbi:30S ribosomal protein S6 [Candidatus Kaiserbacteria bacterium]|nr:30S ribosomal protein S6 [Candidatus Kaiserbacteria bacterium]